ncbi:MAG: hypothetical protein ACM3QZ_09715 [Solirubrobacterales bacterium]
MISFRRFTPRLITPGKPGRAFTNRIFQRHAPAGIGFWREFALVYREQAAAAGVPVSDVIHQTFHLHLRLDWRSLSAEAPTALPFRPASLLPHARMMQQTPQVPLLGPIHARQSGKAPVLPLVLTVGQKEAVSQNVSGPFAQPSAAERPGKKKGKNSSRSKKKQALAEPPPVLVLYLPRPANSIAAQSISRVSSRLMRLLHASPVSASGSNLAGRFGFDSTFRLSAQLPGHLLNQAQRIPLTTGIRHLPQLRRSALSLLPELASEGSIAYATPLDRLAQAIEHRYTGEASGIAAGFPSIELRQYKPWRTESAEAVMRRTEATAAKPGRFSADRLLKPLVEEILKSKFLRRIASAESAATPVRHAADAAHPAMIAWAFESQSLREPGLARRTIQNRMGKSQQAFGFRIEPVLSAQTRAALPVPAAPPLFQAYSVPAAFQAMESILMEQVRENANPKEIRVFDSYQPVWTGLRPRRSEHTRFSAAIAPTPANLSGSFENAVPGTVQWSSPELVLHDKAAPLTQTAPVREPIGMQFVQQARPASERSAEAVYQSVLRRIWGDPPFRGTFAAGPTARALAPAIAQPGNIPGEAHSQSVWPGVSISPRPASLTALGANVSSYPLANQTLRKQAAALLPLVHPQYTRQETAPVLAPQEPSMPADFGSKRRKRKSKATDSMVLPAANQAETSRSLQPASALNTGISLVSPAQPGTRSEGVWRPLQLVPAFNHALSLDNARVKPQPPDAPLSPGRLFMPRREAPVLETSQAVVLKTSNQTAPKLPGFRFGTAYSSTIQRSPEHASQSPGNPRWFPLPEAWLPSRSLRAAVLALVYRTGSVQTDSARGTSAPPEHGSASAAQKLNLSPNGPALSEQAEHSAVLQSGGQFTNWLSPSGRAGQDSWFASAARHSGIDVVHPFNLTLFRGAYPAFSASLKALAASVKTLSHTSHGYNGLGTEQASARRAERIRMNTGDSGSTAIHRMPPASLRAFEQLRTRVPDRMLTLPRTADTRSPELPGQGTNVAVPVEYPFASPVPLHRETGLVSAKPEAYPSISLHYSETAVAAAARLAEKIAGSRQHQPGRHVQDTGSGGHAFADTRYALTRRRFGYGPPLSLHSARQITLRPVAQPKTITPAAAAEPVLGYSAERPAKLVYSQSNQPGGRSGSPSASEPQIHSAMPAVTTSVTTETAPGMPPISSTEIRKIADQVFREIQSRMKFDRQRRGL